MAGREQTSPAPQLSVPALAGLLCSLLIFCPLATLAGIGLGAAALRQIRVKPHVAGRNIAWAAIAVGIVATACQAGAAWWWHVNARVPMKQGPAEALRAGFNGDILSFKAGFYSDTAAAGDREALRFLNTLADLYGAFIECEQRQTPDADPNGALPERGRMQIPYTFIFANDRIDGEAEFLLIAPDNSPIFKFTWVKIQDEDKGSLVYPSSAQQRKRK